MCEVGETKTLEGFHRSATGREGRALRCRECRNEDARRYVDRRRKAEADAEQRGALVAIEDLTR